MTLSLIDKLAIFAFDLIAYAKGLSFKLVKSEEQIDDMDAVYGEEGFTFPQHLRADIEKYKAGTLNFIAYHRGTPAGTIRLANPKIINRQYDHYGVDKEGQHYEIQSLVVRQQFRHGSRFVMLGLVKKLYVYSLANSITSWSACGRRNIYLSMRRYNKNIKVVDIDFKSIDHPVTQYLYKNNIIETYFIMDLTGFKPTEIFKNTIKNLIR